MRPGDRAAVCRHRRAVDLGEDWRWCPACGSLEYSSLGRWVAPDGNDTVDKGPGS